MGLKYIVLVKGTAELIYITNTRDTNWVDIDLSAYSGEVLLVYGTSWCGGVVKFNLDTSTVTIIEQTHPSLDTTTLTIHNKVIRTLIRFNGVEYSGCYFVLQ